MIPSQVSLRAHVLEATFQEGRMGAQGGTVETCWKEGEVVRILHAMSLGGFPHETGLHLPGRMWFMPN